MVLAIWKGCKDLIYDNLCCLKELSLFTVWILVQKYRLYLRRLSGVSQHQNPLNNSFLSAQDATFGAISSLNGMDLQTLAAAGQLPAQSLATLQAAGLGRPTAKAGIPMPLVDQRNLFSFENPRLRFGEGQQQHNMSGNKPMNLLHGIPTNMEPKQLANLHQSTQSLGSLNVRVNAPSAQSSPLLTQMSQSQSRGHMLSENAVSQVPRLATSMGQSAVTNGAPNGVIGRNGVADSNRGAGYNPVPQSSSMLNFPTMNQTTEMSVGNFPIGSTPGISNMTSKGTYQDGVNSGAGIKGSSGFVPSYDIFNELHQQKSHDWEIQNMGLTYDTSQHANPLQGNQHANPLQGNLDVSPSVLVHHGFSSSTQQGGQNRDATSIGKAMFSLGEGMEPGHFQNIGHHLNTLVPDNSMRVKAERIPDANSQTNLFPDQYGQEDLMSALLKQVGSYSTFI